MEKKKTTLLELYFSFCCIGALTFGGGYSMLPMLERECVQKHGWATQEQLLDYFAISQCTPGIIAVNTATFIGHSQRGLKGSIAAALGVVSPSILIILLIANLLNSFAHIPAVKSAFAGISVAVCVLIINSVVKMFKSSVKDWLGIALCIAAFICIAVFSLSPVFPVLGAALVGIGFRRGEQKKEEGKAK